MTVDCASDPPTVTLTVGPTERRSRLTSEPTVLTPDPDTDPRTWNLVQAGASDEVELTTEKRLPPLAQSQPAPASRPTLDLDEVSFVSVEELASIEVEMSGGLRASDLFGALSVQPASPPASEPPHAPPLQWPASSGPWPASTLEPPPVVAAVSAPPPALSTPPARLEPPTRSSSAGAWVVCALCVLAAVATGTAKTLHVGVDDVANVIDSARPARAAATRGLANAPGAAVAFSPAFDVVAWQPSATNASWMLEAEPVQVPAMVLRVNKPVVSKRVAAPPRAPVAPKRASAPQSPAPSASSEDHDAAAAARDQLRDSL